MFYTRQFDKTNYKVANVFYKTSRQNYNGWIKLEVLIKNSWNVNTQQFVFIDFKLSLKQSYISTLYHFLFSYWFLYRTYPRTCQ